MGKFTLVRNLTDDAILGTGSGWDGGVNHFEAVSHKSYTVQIYYCRLRFGKELSGGHDQQNTVGYLKPLTDRQQKYDERRRDTKMYRKKVAEL